MKRSSTSTMTRKLALVFAGLAVLVGLVLYLLIREAIMLAEDNVSLRHLEANRGFAEALYLTGATGPQQLDEVTFAYNDPAALPAFIPDQYRYAVREQAEIQTDYGEFFILVDRYYQGDEQKPIYLLAHAEPLELTEHEGGLISLVIIAITAILLSSLGAVLIRLSARLIKPVNDLSHQLVAHQGDPERPFTITPGAAREFQILTDELNHYRREVNRLLKREQAFARYTSHELRTPLTIIRGAARLLDSGGEPAFRQRQQQRIVSAATRMEETVEALLSLVRYERHEERLSRLLSQAELEAILEQNRPAAQGKPIEFALTVTGEPTIEASEAVVAMVVGNLVRNAIGATPEGTIQIHQDWESLTISDPGLGLDESQGSDEGHGLGLLIVTDLCHRYGWQFSLENRPEGGCQAQIRFGPPASR
ncbi:sensor histidine kinase [Ferrimonas balearica]|uniref:sensor histidine kinase n=1 Tax=Ferrimonas balearica TaxID=44012 RepID=UPI001C99D3E5|nr:HAMP domain-containing sensor histidine kinase [Ferrimonas balearica]MBY5921906.1 HAMP domain-containing histidine kinase [Ferrimonas balearica]MBY5994754.1 HAMP domain-containing histidine kinase [Ferrimonas balearica]